MLSRHITSYHRLFASGLLLFVLVVAALALAADRASADPDDGSTLYVDDDAPGGGNGSKEKPYNKIQDAINASSAGDTIRVWNGTYYENVIVNKSLSLIGNGSADTTIDGSDGGHTVQISADLVNMSGFDIRNGDSGVYLNGREHCRIFDNTFINNSHGINLWSSSNNTIHSNIVTLSTEWAAFMVQFKCHYNHITNNTVIDNEDNGIYLGSECYHNVIRDNLVSDNRGFEGIGIFLDHDATDNHVINNTVLRNKVGIELNDGSDHNLIAYNEVHDNTHTGIALINMFPEWGEIGNSNNSLMNNTIYGNPVGINVSGESRDNTAHGNRIYNNTGYGMDAAGNDNHTVNATDNWWGNDSGPYHPTANPNGTGDNVTDNVLFDPWTGKDEYEEPGENRTEFYVDDDAPGGGDGSKEHPYRKIQDAIDNASAGATVYVWDGVYNESVIVDSPLTIVGNGSAGTIIDNGNGWVHGVVIDADHVNISGFTVRNNARHGIMVNTSSMYGNIFDNNLSGNGRSGIALVTQPGIGHMTIRDNTISHNGNHGVMVQSATGHNIIIHNNIYSNAQRGISISKAPENTVENNTVHGNRFGIYLSGNCNDNVLRNNTVENNTDDGITVSGNHNRLRNNTVKNNGDIGIDVAGAHNTTIADSVITGNSYGIEVRSGAENVTVHDSTIDGNSDYGLSAAANGGIEVNAVENWWGSDSGPHHPTANPNGTGDNITDHVLFDPWLGKTGEPSENITEIYVDVADGNDTRRIMDAIDSVMEGGTVTVSGGTFYGNLVIDKRVNLIGSGSMNTTTMVGDGTGDVIRITADGTNLSGFVVTGSGENHAGIRVESDHNHIWDVNCRDNGDGIWLISSMHDTINGSTFTGNRNNGIYLDRSGYAAVRGNTISGNRMGIYLYDPPGGSTVRGNDIFGNAEYGIFVSDSDYPMDARHSWWGHESGPYHPSDNPVGKGDNLSGDVIFDPWTGKEIFFTKYVWAAAPDGGNGSKERPFNRIQDAIDNATQGAGATIHVWNGTYYENVVVNKSVSLVGNGSASTVIHGNGTGDVITIRADWVNLSGFNITGSGSSNSGVRVENEEVTISRTRCYGNTYGINLISSSANITLDRNNCSSNGYGIYLLSSRDNIIVNNTCTANTNSGLYLSSSHDNSIVNNTLGGENNYGMFLVSSSSNLLSRNNCSGNKFYGIYSSSSDHNVFTMNNILHHSSTNNRGIYLTNSDFNRFENNTVSGNYCGIYVRSLSKGNAVHNNNITENSDHGIDASNNNGYIIDATDNWWGSNYGPYHPANNPDGQGDRITDYVLFDPWTVEHSYVYADAPDGGDGTEERPYNRIQDAIDNASAGAIIHVWEGNYEENVSVERQLTIIGNGSFATTIDGGSGGDVVSVNAGAVHLEGFGIMRSGGAPGAGVHLMADGTYLREVRFSNNGYGVFFDAAGSNTLEDCSFDGNELNLFLDGSSTDNRLENTPYGDDYVVADENFSSFTVWWDLNVLVQYPGNGTPMENAHVLIMDADDTVIFDGQTDENGTIPTWLIKQGRVDNTTMDSFTPHRLIVTADGFGEVNELVTVDTSRNIIRSLPVARAEYQNGGVIFPVEAAPFIFIDEGDSIDLDAGPSEGAGLAYLWTWEDDSTYSFRDPAPRSYDKAGAYVVTLRVTDMYGNGDTLDIVVAVRNLEPHCAVITIDGGFNWSEGYDIEFEGSAVDNDALVYTWDFGDGTGIHTGETVVHNFTQEGSNITVTLTVTDDDGARVTAQVLVNISNELPEPYFEILTGGPGADRWYAGQEIEFSAAGSTDTYPDKYDLHYKWDFGDGRTVQGKSRVVVSHDYDMIGNYTVILTVRDDDGAEDYFTYDVEIINNPPVPEISNIVGEYHEGEDVEIDGFGSNDVEDERYDLNYTWAIDSEVVAYGVSFTMNFTNAGIYNVSLTVRDKNNSRTTDYRVLEILSIPPDFRVDADKTTVDVDEIIRFNLTDLSNLTYDANTTFAWDFGDGDEYEGNLTIVEHSYDTEGKYTVAINATDNDGTSIEKTIAITVNKPAPRANFTINGEITDANGTLYVNESVEVTLDASASTGAAQHSFLKEWTFELEGEGDGEFEQSRILTFAVTTTHAFPQSGNLTITLRVQADGAWSDPFSIEIIVNNTAPTASMKRPSGSKKIIEGESIILDGSDSSDTPGDINALTYSWKNADTGAEISTEAIYVWTPSKAGHYNITLTVTDQDGASHTTGETMITVEEKELEKPPGDDDDDEIPIIGAFLMGSCLLCLLLPVIVVGIAVVFFIKIKKKKEKKAVEGAAPFVRPARQPPAKPKREEIEEREKTAMELEEILKKEEEELKKLEEDLRRLELGEGSDGEEKETGGREKKGEHEKAGGAGEPGKEIAGADEGDAGAVETGKATGASPGKVEIGDAAVEEAGLKDDHPAGSRDVGVEEVDVEGVGIEELEVEEAGLKDQHPAGSHDVGVHDVEVEEVDIEGVEIEELEVEEVEVKESGKHFMWKKPGK